MWSNSHTYLNENKLQYLFDFGYQDDNQKNLLRKQAKLAKHNKILGNRIWTRISLKKNSLSWSPRHGKSTYFSGNFMLKYSGVWSRRGLSLVMEITFENSIHFVEK